MTLLRSTETLRRTSLLAFGASFALAAATAFAQGAAPQPTPTATPTDKAAPAKTAWEDLDINKDGNLSKEETTALPALNEVFDKADSNADGVLTADEYRTYLAATKDDHGKQKMDDKK
jgi:hypothetical protein